MSVKTFTRLMTIIPLIGMIAFLGATSARAQCGEPPLSSCATCHAIEDPVNEKGEWHIIHASKDVCINCHGGNASAAEKEPAHENLTAHPLEDIYTDCHSCHPDYDERARRFSITLGVTPGGCPTPTPLPPVNYPAQPPSAGISLSDATAASQSIALIGGLFLLVAFLTIGATWLEKRHVL